MLNEVPNIPAKTAATLADHLLSYATESSHSGISEDVILKLNGSAVTIAREARSHQLSLPKAWHNVDVIVANPHSPDGTLAEMTMPACKHYLDPRFHPTHEKLAIAVAAIPVQNGKISWALIDLNHSRRITHEGAQGSIHRLTPKNLPTVVYRRTNEHPETLEHTIRSFDHSPIIICPDLKHDLNFFRHHGARDARKLGVSAEVHTEQIFHNRLESLVRTTKAANDDHCIILLNSPGDLHFAFQHFPEAANQFGLAIKDLQKLEKYLFALSSSKEQKFAEQIIEPSILTINFDAFNSLLRNDILQKDGTPLSSRKNFSLANLLEISSSTICVWGVHTPEQCELVRKLGLLPVIKDRRLHSVTGSEINS